MFKSWGGSGTVSNVVLSNFIGHSNAYTLDLDATWSSMTEASGDGVLYTNFTFSDWKGTCLDGHERGPVKFNCPPDEPCTDMVVEDFNVWTEDGDYVEYWCYNAYGSGVCLNEADATTTYTTTQTVSTVSDYSIQTMANEISAGLGLTVSIDIPTLRATFFPGVAAYSALMADSDDSSAAVTATAASSAAAAATSAAEQDVETSSSTPAAAASSVVSFQTLVSTAAATTKAAATTTSAVFASKVSTVVSEVESEASSAAAELESTTEVESVAIPTTTAAPAVSSSTGSSRCRAQRRRDF